jgi:hypothetical protein
MSPFDIHHLFIRLRKQSPCIKNASENPVLWTGMKGVSAEGRKKADQMLKQVQHDIAVRFWSFCHPEPYPELVSWVVSGSRFWV